MNSGNELFFSQEFKKQVQKIKDNKQRERIKKAIEKIRNNPNIGKPLRYRFKGRRSLKIPPFRLVYTKIKGGVLILSFKHRTEVYK